MIAFAWTIVTALGFMLAGVLLWEFEWKIGGLIFLAAWTWTLFPKATVGLVGAAGKLLRRRVVATKS